MKCVLCNKQNIESNNENNDCIIRYLDKIKVHYIGFKEELQETKSSLSNVKEINEKLQAKIELLETQLKKTSSNSDDSNLEKTNSFHMEKEDNIEPTKQAKILANISTDDLNKVINSSTEMEEDDEDSFFVPTQTKAPATINKQQITPTKALLTEELLPLPQVKPSPEAFLPKRLKYKPARRSFPNNHNATLNTSKWISTERINLRACKDINTNVNPQLNESVKSSENVHHSPTRNKETSPNTRKRKKFLSPPKLRQTKLNFKENIRTEINKDCDDDIVEASPTSAIHILECVKSIKIGTGRKLNQQKSVLSLSAKTSSLNTIGVKEPTTSTPTTTNIKGEPETVKKPVHTNLFPSKSTYSDSKKELNDNSSLFVLQSQPDDLILIEDSDFEDISSSALLEEMTNYTDGISESLQRFKEERIKQQRQQQLQEESENKIALERDNKISAESKQLETFDCKECEAVKYFNYLGQNLSKEEIAKRLSNCKHKKSVQLNETPDGFWDPIFRSLPDDDPRNITLIDTRFIDKRL